MKATAIQLRMKKALLAHYVEPEWYANSSGKCGDDGAIQLGFWRRPPTGEGHRLYFTILPSGQTRLMVCFSRLSLAVAAIMPGEEKPKQGHWIMLNTRTGVAQLTHTAETALQQYTELTRYWDLIL